MLKTSSSIWRVTFSYFLECAPVISIPFRDSYNFYEGPSYSFGYFEPLSSARWVVNSLVFAARPGQVGLLEMRENDRPR